VGNIQPMQSGYVGILLLVAVAAIICGAMVTLSWVLGPKKLTPYKESPYECGVAPVGDAKERFPIKFYLVAIVFILFDIEVVFLWPWMTVFKTSDTNFLITSFTSFALYMLTFIVGYIYVIRVGAIDWDETTSLDPAKLAEEDAASPDPELVPAVGVTA
jgi:NADH-quinone oxidoreductase subunit A